MARAVHAVSLAKRRAADSLGGRRSREQGAQRAVGLAQRLERASICASPAAIVSWPPLTEPTIWSATEPRAPGARIAPGHDEAAGRLAEQRPQWLDGVGEHDLGAEPAGEAALGERRRQAALGDVMGAREQAARTASRTAM